jgi:hypothetical protein
MPFEDSRVIPCGVEFASGGQRAESTSTERGVSRRDETLPWPQASVLSLSMPEEGRRHPWE